MRSKPFIIIAASLVAVLLLSAGVIAYDRSKEETIAKGVRIGGVDVGGLTRQEAQTRLEDRLLAVLRQPLKVHHGNVTWKLEAERSKVDADIPASVASAVAASRSGGLLTRTVRNLTGGEVDEDITPTVSYDKDAVVRLLDKIRRRVDRKAIDAKVEFGVEGLKRIDGRDGLKVNASELHQQMRKALVSTTGERRLVATTRHTKPKVTTKEVAKKYGTVLVVHRNAFKITLYKNLKKVKSYGIAVGQAGLDTPAGLYSIQNKAVNPAWHVPNSAWAGDLAGKVIPGGIPSNPIKARWMGVYDGVGVHGTGDPGSIGTRASHGCIRMRVPEVIELYDKVPVGAPIYIA